MQIKIIQRDLYQLALFTYRHCLFRKPIGHSTARFHLHKDQIVFIFCHDINLTITTAEITFQNTITTLYQSLGSQAFTCSAKALARCFRSLIVLLYQAPLFYITTT
jgi:hypothetical protein